MAAKGGGSWKVAYADFVTAMMAFFLVMWIGAQDQKTRQSVANYFVDPAGAVKKPARTGATFDTVSYGSLPDAEKAALGRGRDSYSTPGEHGSATKMVGDWLAADKKAHDHWKEQARACLAAAAKSPEVAAKTAPVEAVAARELAGRLRTALTANLPPKTHGVHADLMYWSLGEVNWTEIAEDLLGR